MVDIQTLQLLQYYALRCQRLYTKYQEGYDKDWLDGVMYHLIQINLLLIKSNLNNEQYQDIHQQIETLSNYASIDYFQVCSIVENQLPLLLEKINQTLDKQSLTIKKD